jgi:Fe-S-cluster containining protein
MDAEIIEIDPNRPFRFACGPAVTCFNACCRDLNQYLTPYDILRLKTRLGMDSGQFLARYAAIHDGPETGLPVVTLRPKVEPGDPCPFVSPRGCRVYEDRPSSCRTYPLMRMAVRDPATGRIAERFFLLKEPHCRGFSQETRQTVAAWMAHQQLTVYNEMNDRMLALISLKRRHRPGPLDLRARRLFIMGLYDLDDFRRRVFAPELHGDDRFDPDLRQAAREDDTALLQLAMEWVERELFPADG